MNSETTKRRFQFTDQDDCDVTEKIWNFADTIGLEKIATGRYSVVLLLQLYGSYASRMQNPWKIVREIEALECPGQMSTTKLAQPFTGALLKGLMHKHYHADGIASLAINLRNELGEHGIPEFEQRIAEANAAGEERYMTEEDINLIAHDATVGAFERRIERKEFTGEWIIYAEHEDKNYYLCVGRHDSGDAELRRQIESVCCKEFPFLHALPCFASTPNS